MESSSPVPSGADLERLSEELWTVAEKVTATAQTVRGAALDVPEVGRALIFLDSVEDYGEMIVRETATGRKDLPEAYRRHRGTA